MEKLYRRFASLYLQYLQLYLKNVGEEEWKKKLLKAGFDPQTPLHSHLYDKEELIKRINEALKKAGNAPVEHIRELFTVLHPVAGEEKMSIMYLMRDGEPVIWYQREGKRPWESPLPTQEDSVHILTRGGYLKLKIKKDGTVEVKPRRVESFDHLGMSSIHGVLFSHPEGGVVYVHVGKNRHEVKRPRKL